MGVSIGMDAGVRCVNMVVAIGVSISIRIEV